MFCFFSFLLMNREMDSNLTPTSGQDSTSNSQSVRSKTDPTWEHIYEEICSNGRKLTCMYCKKVKAEEFIE